MAELKTQPTDTSVKAFLDAIPDEKRRQDCKTIAALMTEVTQEPPVLWGSSIVGFGRHRYQYASGRTGEWMLIGFAPRKNDITLYLSQGMESHSEQLASLGKHKAGKGCLYLKKLEDVDVAVLRALLTKSVEHFADKRINQPVEKPADTSA